MRPDNRRRGVLGDALWLLQRSGIICIYEVSARTPKHEWEQAFKVIMPTESGGLVETSRCRSTSRAYEPLRGNCRGKTAVAMARSPIVLWTADELG